MQRVTWAAMSSGDPMGQQHYESRIQRTIAELAGPDWRFRELRVASARSAAGGHVRRVPMGAYFRAPLPLALAMGAVAYRTGQLVHRLDLRIPPAPGPEVVTIHDLPPLRFGDEGTIPHSAAAGARRARRVICPSRFAATEVCELLGVAEENVSVIPNGVDEIFFDPDLAAPRVMPDGPFVVHAAGATERKNLAALADAWRMLVPKHPGLSLVLAGPVDDRRTRLFSDLPGTRLVGRLPSRDIAGLMRRAAAVVVPSKYEGFGLPALEGMAAGCPVVVADAGALPEICGDAAIVVSTDAEAIAAGLERALTDDDERARLVEAGPRRARDFSWAESARQHLDVYRKVLS